MKLRRVLWLGCLVALPALAQEANGRAAAIARHAPPAKAALTYIQREVHGIPDARVRRVAQAMLANPAPSFMARLAKPEARAKVAAKLVRAGLLDPKVTAAQLFPPLVDPHRAPQPFLAAPAQGLHGHHAYPGGLAAHTAFNLRTALSYAASYERQFGFRRSERLDRTLLIAGPVLHDIMKAWTLQWRADGSITDEATIAGTSSHHIFGIAEAFHRKLPAKLIVVIASAHAAPTGRSASKVVGFLRAGAILAGVDPVAAGVLVRDGAGFRLAHPASIEAAINHLSDSDYVVSGPAGKIIDGVLNRLIARAAAGHRPPTTPRRRWLRDRVEARIPPIRLYAIWLKGGDAAVAAVLRRERIRLVPAERRAAASSRAAR